ncbi:MAG: LysM peptidoglycan-binding domain-containing protein [Candidatus Krumholzibacteria bacterium]|nr:LysM peptidoglycan-binding domain-containing protein [Candidatus Krumholzibacteria bacterium]
MLHRKLDEAEAFYRLGNLDYSLSLSDQLLVDIGDFQATSPEGFVCSHLDTLELRTALLRAHIIEEETSADWSRHMAAVLDSIGRHHIVEETIDITMNWRTEHWIRYFTGKGRKHFDRWLERAEKYRDIIEPILVENQIPRDLLYLSVIESGLNLTACSSVKATGPWQFMAGTGRLFGLRTNWWIDERSDLVASTYAAANYLKYLHGLFGNWELALAAYNAGEYRVADAISRQKTDDYWRLRLPSQTRWFVPKFMAALEIGRNPEKYGFSVASVQPLRFDVVVIKDSIDLKHIAAGAGCTVRTVKELNPALKRWATPPDMEIELKVPHGSAKDVVAAIEKIPAEERISWHRHSVQRGEALSRIADRYEISQAELKRINGITDVHRIREGQILLIPVRDSGAGDSGVSRPRYMDPPSLPSQISMKRYTPPEDHDKIVYTVKDRDTLSEIAERFGIGLSKLRRWNDLRYNSVIHPGDNLVIYLPPGSAAAAGRADVSEDEPSGVEGRQKVMHIVQSGETLSAISRRYGTTVSAILSWNTSVRRDRLHPGDRLTIWIESE